MLDLHPDVAENDTDDGDGEAEQHPVSVGDGRRQPIVCIVTVTMVTEFCLFIYYITNFT